MSSTLLELARSSLEDAEVYEKEISTQLDSNPKTAKQRVLQGHRINNLLLKIQECCGSAAGVFDDKDGTRRDEEATMKGRDLMANYYNRLRETREYHARFPNLMVKNGPSLETDMEANVNFSGEEMYGKYVDLNAFYVRATNMPQFAKLYSKASPDDDVEMEEDGGENNNSNGSNNGSAGKKRKASQTVENKIDYIDFLERFSDFTQVPRASKTSEAYRSYVSDLLAYLRDFYARSQPLVAQDELLAESAQEFSGRWEEGTLPGWERGQSDPLLCGPCGKRFGNSNVFAAHLNGKKHKKAAAKAEAGEGAAATTDGAGAGGAGALETLERGVASDEATVLTLAGVLAEEIAATRSMVEKKLTRTLKEREEELRVEEEGVAELVEEEEEEEDSDEDVPIYNPLNLPLGWDGKPIPYWLYKLHGLGVEFKCEICGDVSYWGRRAFDRHFQEWRHAHGMRCLKIPNTKHFHDITLIEDAINLYAKIKDTVDAEQWKAEDQEEFEDSEGHVLNRKTFEDLARQGML